MTATPHQKATGLTRRQKSALRKDPPDEQIRTRREGEKDLTYLEGWYVISEANRIFGHENWDRITLATQCISQSNAGGTSVCAYTARVRVRVRAGAITLVREGSGIGQARGTNAGEAHGIALKTAETDATKRALATLGAPFGLTLYDRDGRPPESEEAKEPEPSEPARAQRPGERVSHAASSSHMSGTEARTPMAPWIVRDATGEPSGVFRDPILCCSGLRRAIEAANTTVELETLFGANRRTLARLAADCPDLRSDSDQHYTTILASLFQARLKRLSTRETTAAGEHIEGPRSVSAPLAAHPLASMSTDRYAAE